MKPDKFDGSLLCVLLSTAVLLYLVGNVRFLWNSCIVCYSSLLYRGGNDSGVV